MKGLWYLASPYSKYPAGLEFAAADVSRIAGALMKQGIAVFSPIAHSHPIAIAAEMDPLDHSIWLPFDEHMMKACVGIIVAKMDGWRESYGVKYEIDHFEKAGKPVFFYDPSNGAIEPPPE